MPAVSLRARRPSLVLDLSLSKPSSNNILEERESEALRRFKADFDVGADIGIGTFSVVRRARRRSDDRPVAIKCIDTEDFEQRASFRREFEVLKSISHQAVVPVFQFYDCGRCVYFSMELGDQDVHQHLKKHGSFEEAEALRLFGNLLSGVSALHCRRIVHCDIKPPNLLLHVLNDQRVLKIADFNSARRIGLSSSSRMLTHRGTLNFQAPEIRLEGMWNERVDIWACGITFYLMLRGVMPFHLSSRVASRSILVGKMSDMSWGNISLCVRHLTKQCLAVDQRDRPPALELMQHPAFCGVDLGLAYGCASPESDNQSGSLSAVEDYYDFPDYVFGWCKTCGFLSLTHAQLYDPGMRKPLSAFSDGKRSRSKNTARRTMSEERTASKASSSLSVDVDVLSSDGSFACETRAFSKGRSTKQSVAQAVTCDADIMRNR
eukprot:TRINITY_DN23756_c0_g1_i4.p1 TRINITY_DN23756_c0_g1~~TRINITY_DN23756_c0_g1_i4.p1  ORF type:complete len:455 (+),score=34.35 TRINITY_DN23756_c0_g1_i4:62-1366(+)